MTPTNTGVLGTPSHALSNTMELCKVFSQPLSGLLNDTYCLLVNFDPVSFCLCTCQHQRYNSAVNLSQCMLAAYTQ